MDTVTSSLSSSITITVHFPMTIHHHLIHIIQPIIRSLMIIHSHLIHINLLIKTLPHPIWNPSFVIYNLTKQLLLKKTLSCNLSILYSVVIHIQYAVFYFLFVLDVLLYGYLYFERSLLFTAFGFTFILSSFTSSFLSLLLTAFLI